MQCPRTKSELIKLTVGKIEIFSSAYGGVFFDNRQIASFNDPSQRRAVVLAEHLSSLPIANVDLKARINCPKCPSIVMMRRFFTPLHVVEIDECPSCGGIWLDAGELTKIHENYLTKKERAILANQQANEHGFVNFDIPTNRFSERGLKKVHNSNIESLVALAISSFY